MPEKFKNKYRIPSARLQNWDYGWNASYFLTICTQNRQCFFGDITNAEMELSEIGEIAHKYWNEIPAHFPFVKLDAFVVMPNHVHGIIIILPVM
jgi:putative transposase